VDELVKRMSGGIIWEALVWIGLDPSAAGLR
jgi:hypothetical protein